MLADTCCFLVTCEISVALLDWAHLLILFSFTEICSIETFSAPAKINVSLIQRPVCEALISMLWIFHTRVFIFSPNFVMEPH
jgi:hypothetical protein